MFKKKPTIKSLTQIRSSDRRKLADQIISDFGLDEKLHQLQDESVRAAETIALRNALLPDSNLQAAKFATTAGPNLKPVSGTLYVAPHAAGTHAGSSGPLRVLWVRFNDRMYPTVYTLWKNPRIVPLLHTPDAVVSKIQTGASLMTPGLSDPPPFPKGATKGAIVAIASHESPSVPLAVGTCVIDVAGLTDVHGAKGHAVEPIHWLGDEVWAWSAAGAKGVDPPAELPAWLQDNADEDGEEAVGNLVDGESLTEDKPDGSGQVDGIADVKDQPHETAQQVQQDTHSPVKVDEADELAQGVEDVEIEDVSSRSWSQKDIDNAFHDSFIYGVRHFMKTNRSQRNYGLDFPLSQSSVMSTLIQPFLPIYGPADAEALTIKKTSWKAVKKFIRQLAKEKIVKMKEQGNNEVVILEIDFEHAEVVNFMPLHKVPKNGGWKSETRGTSGSGSADSPAPTAPAPTAASNQQGENSGATSSQTQSRPELKFSIYYRPKSFLAPVFQSHPSPYLTRPDVQNCLNAYITAENLISPADPRMARLDPVLSALFPLSGSAPPPTVCQRSVLLERVLGPAASPTYWLLHPASQSASEALSNSMSSTTNSGKDSVAASSVSAPPPAKPKAGPPPRLTLTLETRAGNKAVSRLTGLEPFSIRPQSLADELRRACAASTSVERASGVKKGVEAWEVMVQGKRTKDVISVLAGFGVREEWVDLVDKCKGKKK